MAELVGQHGLDLVAVQARQQRVEEDNAARAAEAGEVGVAVRGTARAVHHEQTVEREAAALRQALDASGQIGIGQGRELVEQRGDEHRIDDEQRQVEHHPEAPGPGPPVRAGAAHQPQHGGGQRQPQHGRHQQALERVRHEQPGCHAVETETGFQSELPPQREWQSQQAQQQRHGHQQQHLAQEVVAGKLAYRQIDGLQAAQQGQAHQHDGVVGPFQHAQPHARHGVVRRALVAGQADAVREFGWHLFTVAGDMTDLARGQPQAHGNVDQQEGDEQQGEHVRVGCSVRDMRKSRVL